RGADQHDAPVLDDVLVEGELLSSWAPPRVASEARTPEHAKRLGDEGFDRVDIFRAVEALERLKVVLEVAALLLVDLVHAAFEIGCELLNDAHFLDLSVVRLDLHRVEDRIEQPLQGPRPLFRPVAFTQLLVDPQHAEPGAEQVGPLLEPVRIGGVTAGAASREDQDGAKLVGFDAAVDDVDAVDGFAEQSGIHDAQIVAAPRALNHGLHIVDQCRLGVEDQGAVALVRILAGVCEHLLKEVHQQYGFPAARRAEYAERGDHAGAVDRQLADRLPGKGEVEQLPDAGVLSRHLPCLPRSGAAHIGGVVDPAAARPLLQLVARPQPDAAVDDDLPEALAGHHARSSNAAH